LPLRRTRLPAGMARQRGRARSQPSLMPRDLPAGAVRLRRGVYQLPKPPLAPLFRPTQVPGGVALGHENSVVLNTRSAWMDRPSPPCGRERTHIWPIWPGGFAFERQPARSRSVCVSDAGLDCRAGATASTPVMHVLSPRPRTGACCCGCRRRLDSLTRGVAQVAAKRLARPAWRYACQGRFGYPGRRCDLLVAVPPGAVRPRKRSEGDTASGTHTERHGCARWV